MVSSNFGSSLGSCTRCRTLKVKCELKTETGPCKRCSNGGHDCVTPRRKKRRTLPEHHLLNHVREQAAEIREQAAMIRGLTAKLEQTNARLSLTPNLSATDAIPPVPSSFPFRLESSFSPSGYDTELSSSARVGEAHKVVDDWISKARDSSVEFDGSVGIGGAGMSKRYLKRDPEDLSSEEIVISENEDMGNDCSDSEMKVLDPEGEEAVHLGRNNQTHPRTDAGTRSRKKDFGNMKRQPGSAKLATLPSEASPFGLMADLSLKKSRVDCPEDTDTSALGVANLGYFRPAPTPDTRVIRSLGGGHSAPQILTQGLITLYEAEKLFDIYFKFMNVSVSLLDPVLYTPQKTCFRSPFLFTVVCAIASRFYPERSELYPQAMHLAQLAAGTTLISGQKCVELCQGYILLSLHPVPVRRWEEERGWLYLGLAIRMAMDLNLHLPNTAEPIKENHAREMLNRTRLWLICFNLDRSTGSQYGKAPTISNSDYMASHSEDWWRTSPYNLANFDIHICALTAESRVMAAFLAKIHSDPDHPTGLNKSIDYERVAAETDEELKWLAAKWLYILAQTDMTDPQNRFRSGLLKLAFRYARLVTLSFGFQHAYGKNNTDENPFLMRCLTAASDVVATFVKDVGRLDQRVYLLHGPIEQTVVVTFAASMLLKLLQPEFASYLTTGKRHEIRGLVQRVVELLASPAVSIDERHWPNLYARFLKRLLPVPLAKRQRQPEQPNTNQPMFSDSPELYRDSSNNTSQGTRDSLLPWPIPAALSFAPPLVGGVDPKFMPFGTDADPSAQNLPPSLP
ncbi:hypothetical protein B0H15DRAFT_779840 [Mycena belliarum]|uniref:Zn(2)-C6 fungal-type domain-containing protein n=1 Tax=Mycena belliarum TaxID=1033014 RepID=A0AAD6U988_9AGAR|nr:hypothetical protein B0H15DRAFT_779840 [Mycena belliae]